MTFPSPDQTADQTELLARIAEALDRLAPPPLASCDWLRHPAYVWTGEAARPVPVLDAPALGLLQGIDDQKDRVVTNVERL
ncbi:MAG: ATPase, partial [Novosphingobium sp.]